MAGYKVTDKGQQKNYLYRYDIKKWKILKIT
jgi:hypothetical protein